MARLSEHGVSVAWINMCAACCTSSRALVAARGIDAAPWSFKLRTVVLFSLVAGHGGNTHHLVRERYMTGGNWQ